jgi:hypothetical protein
MTKFMLIIWVCSFAVNPTTCLPPMEFPKQFDSWYECSRGAHKEALSIVSKMGYRYINEHRIALSYSCQELDNI